MKLLLKNLVSFALLILFVQTVNAGEAVPFVQSNKSFVDLTGNEYNVDYFTIASVELEKIQGSVTSAPLNSEKLMGGLGDIFMVVDKLFALGKQIWQVVEAGRPVVTSSFIPFSVLPKVATMGELYEMEGWSAPKAEKYKITYQNFLGMDVVTFDFSIHFQYDGSLNGVGRYITGGNIVPDSIDVSWGYNLDASSKIVTITNRGTSAAPVAAATIQIHYNVSNVLSNVSSDLVFHITGDGQVIKID